MKLKRLRAKAPMVFKIATAIMALGLSAVFPAGAQDLQPRLVELISPVTVNGITCRYRLDGPLPSSTSVGEFSPWLRMHRHTFDGKLGSYVGQCKSTIGKLPWLTNEVCDNFSEALQQGNCAVVQDVNNIRIDVVRGKQNGRSMPFLNEHMSLQEPRQAIFVSLPGDLWLGMFAGEAESCNNFFALQDVPPVKEVEPPPPPPPVKVVVEPPPPPPQGQWVCVNVPAGQVVHSPVGQHLDGFVLQSKCCCGNDTVVPTFNFNIGSTVDSGSGYSERCFWIQPNQTGESQ